MVHLVNSNITLRPGQIAPDFEQDTTNGSIRFHEWIAGSWCVLFSHSREVNVATVAELAQAARLRPEWSRRGVKVIGLSVGSSDAHARWERDLLETRGLVLNFPVVADADGSVSTLYGTSLTDVKISPVMRHVYVIDADKKVRRVQTFSSAIGCDFNGVLRAVDDLQKTAKRIATTSVNDSWAGRDVQDSLTTQT
jgi:alkyl hydroperoxide reductase subunit AhpC